MDPSFWGNNKTAQRKMRELAILKKEVEDWRGIKARSDDLHEFLTIALEERDVSLAESFEEEYSAIKKTVDDLEFKLMLSGEFDERSAMIALHAGAGGVDSQDWVRILMRMYVRWAERRGFKTDILDVSPGEEGGVKTAIIQVTGDYAYGYLRAERGVHRLVRISPFDGNHARHTSFALAEVMPEVEEGVDVTINPDDLRIDVFRAGGHGGQSVQKNSTAIRITHLPTKVVVTCQNERSQHQNKEIAMRILMARLMEIEMKKRDVELSSSTECEPPACRPSATLSCCGTLRARRLARATRREQSQQKGRSRSSPPRAPQPTCRTFVQGRSGRASTQRT